MKFIYMRQYVPQHQPPAPPNPPPKDPTPPSSPHPSNQSHHNHSAAGKQGENTNAESKLGENVNIDTESKHDSDSDEEIYDMDMSFVQCIPLPSVQGRDNNHGEEDASLSLKRKQPERSTPELSPSKRQKQVVHPAELAAQRNLSLETVREHLEENNQVQQNKKIANKDSRLIKRTLEHLGTFQDHIHRFNQMTLISKPQPQVSNTP
jgi:hypothetical protein